MSLPNHIVIATGVYPPEIGGPAEYARQLAETLRTQKYRVSVITYGELKRLPTGIRHIAYFIALIADAFDADYVIALDTFSVALPAMIYAAVLGKKFVVRVAGDFLWESYVERTGEKIKLSDFYTTRRPYSLKEKIIFSLTQWLLSASDRVVFSTAWQRDFTVPAYQLDAAKTAVIENYYPAVQPTPLSENSQAPVFLSPARDRRIKNKDNLTKAFEQIQASYPQVVLDTKVVSREVLLEKIQTSYAVVIPSYSEVSPNLAFDALQYGVPVIMTADTGVLERIGECVVTVDPFSVEDIARALSSLLRPDVYDRYRHSIVALNLSRSWDEVAQGFIDLYSSL